MVTDISIPSGAIKRQAKLTELQAEKNKFQFLLVRLRVIFCMLSFVHCGISIPSGAIKRAGYFVLLRH